MNYTNWYFGQPNNASEDCVALDYDETTKAKWLDESCNAKYHYICEKAAGMLIKKEQHSLYL